MQRRLQLFQHADILQRDAFPALVVGRSVGFEVRLFDRLARETATDRQPVGCRNMKYVPCCACSDRPSIGWNGGLAPFMTAMLLLDSTCMPIHSPTPEKLTDFCAPTVAAC